MGSMNNWLGSSLSPLQYGAMESAQMLSSAGMGDGGYGDHDGHENAILLHGHAPSAQHGPFTAQMLEIAAMRPDDDDDDHHQHPHRHHAITDSPLSIMEASSGDWQFKALDPFNIRAMQLDAAVHPHAYTFNAAMARFSDSDDIVIRMRPSKLENAPKLEDFLGVANLGGSYNDVHESFYDYGQEGSEVNINTMVLSNGGAKPVPPSFRAPGRAISCHQFQEGYRSIDIQEQKVFQTEMHMPSFPFDHPGVQENFLIDCSLQLPSTNVMVMRNGSDDSSTTVFRDYPLQPCQTNLIGSNGSCDRNINMSKGCSLHLPHITAMVRNGSSNSSTNMLRDCSLQSLQTNAMVRNGSSAGNLQACNDHSFQLPHINATVGNGNSDGSINMFKNSLSELPPASATAVRNCTNDNINLFKDYLLQQPHSNALVGNGNSNDNINVFKDFSLQLPPANMVRNGTNQGNINLFNDCSLQLPINNAMSNGISDANITVSTECSLQLPQANAMMSNESSNSNTNFSMQSPQANVMVSNGSSNGTTDVVGSSVQPWVRENPVSVPAMKELSLISSSPPAHKSSRNSLANSQTLTLSMSSALQPTNDQLVVVTNRSAVDTPICVPSKRRASIKVGSEKHAPCKASDAFGQRTSQFRGVTRHRWTGRYEAHLWDNSCRIEGQTRKGRQVYLGGYDKEEKAARAYDLAALKYWGPSCHINFPLCTYEREMEEMKNMTRQEFVASLRRKSTGFSRGASAYRGVTRHHQQGRWQARIGRVAGSKDLYLGTYSTQEEAAEAYDVAAIKFRGPNAVTNFDISRYDVNSICSCSTFLSIREMAGRKKHSLLSQCNSSEDNQMEEESTQCLPKAESSNNNSAASEAPTNRIEWPVQCCSKPYERNDAQFGDQNQGENQSKLSKTAHMEASLSKNLSLRTLEKLPHVNPDLGYQSLGKLSNLCPELDLSKIKMESMCRNETVLSTQPLMVSPSEGSKQGEDEGLLQLATASLYPHARNSDNRSTGEECDGLLQNAEGLSDKATELSHGQNAGLSQKSKGIPRGASGLSDNVKRLYSCQNDGPSQKSNGPSSNATRLSNVQDGDYSQNSNGLSEKVDSWSRDANELLEKADGQILLVSSGLSENANSLSADPNWILESASGHDNGLSLDLGGLPGNGKGLSGESKLLSENATVQGNADGLSHDLSGLLGKADGLSQHSSGLSRKADELSQDASGLSGNADELSQNTGSPSSVVSSSCAGSAENFASESDSGSPEGPHLEVVLQGELMGGLDLAAEQQLDELHQGPLDNDGSRKAYQGWAFATTVGSVK